MPDYMKPEEWLSVVKKEYLQDFVKRGGAAVKFIVPVDCSEPSKLVPGLRALAEEQGFLCASVDSAVIRIHLIEQVFYQVAKQIDWDGMVFSFLYNLLQSHYKLPENRGDFSVKNIALLNGYEEREIPLLINTRLKEVFRDFAMTQEFRIAIQMLCRCQLDPGELSSESCSSIKEWLKGELRLISALKQALIFQKIGRHNARNMLFSLAHWLTLSGKNGLMLVLDISRYTQDKPKEPDGTLYYSTTAMVDCAELLRQFVDGTDEADHLFVVVLAPPRFIDEFDKRRGVGAYDALKLRIWDEVHDKKHANPLASLVRVSSCQNTPG